MHCPLFAKAEAGERNERERRDREGGVEEEGGRPREKGAGEGKGMVGCLQDVVHYSGATTCLTPLV